MCLATLFSITSYAQQLVTVTGSVANNKTKESLSAVSVTIKGTTIGTYTDDKGNFKLSTTQKLPFTLVITSVGFTDKEIAVTTNNQHVKVGIDAKYTMGDEVVVAASRVSERALETPVTIERVSAATIKSAPAANYYDILTNQKGVDANVASLTFRTVSTRGFTTSGNLRFNQIMDGMDNQAPGLNFAVGSFIGLTELDVESMELLGGASSALYGPGGMNGTLLINSKNPFKYQGLSFQIKQGVNHTNDVVPAAPYYNWSLRWAKKVSEKFAFKLGAEMIHATDWVAGNTQNYSRIPTTASLNGTAITGDRLSDPNYDGVNVYGDETTQNMSSIAATVLAGVNGINPAVIPASNAWLAANPTANLTAFGSFLNGIGAGAVVAAGYSAFVYGAAPSRNYFQNQSVSRTGYLEKDVVSPFTTNVKLQGALHYKLTEKIEAILAGFFGTGSTVYTGSDRYALKDLKMAQYKIELKHKDWYVRAYKTFENAGASYNSTITTRLFNEAVKSSTVWYPQYMSYYVNARSLGASNSSAHTGARDFADIGRPTGAIYKSDLFQSIASKPIGGNTNGGLFVDKTTLSMIEGQYNFTDLLKVKDYGLEVIAGANFKQYLLNSGGTLFADSAGRIKINEMGAYVQVQKKFFEDKLKLTASGRYDKNSNFKGKFTPRVSAVWQVVKNQNIRVSYQTAYRFPSTQNQWINLFVSGGARLMGGLPQLRDYYKFGSNPAYTLASFQQFAATGNPSVLQQQVFGEFKPESSTSTEIGYKGLIAKKLMVDAYVYNADTKDFISSVTVVQSPNGLLSGFATGRNAYNISVNSPTTVKTQGWGLSLEYMLPKNFSVIANVYSDEIKDVPAGFATYFNAPKYRYNLGLSNSGLLDDGKLGGSLIYRWQDKFFYEGTFGAGDLPSFGTVDAVLTYKIPQYKSIVKAGGTNIFNTYYRTGWGAPRVGALWYVSYGFNL